LALHVLGTMLYFFFLSGIALFLFIIGAALVLVGTKITKIILFPLVYLVFALPLPIVVIDKISFPLKVFVAKVGVNIVSFLGISVFREGFLITIPAGTLVVGNPCSGLRSIITFLALGALFAYSFKMSRLKKWLLFLASLPIAVASNMIRVTALILISHYYGLDAAGPDTLLHNLTGILVFALGLFLFFSIANFFHETH
jgi:exosortase